MAFPPSFPSNHVPSFLGSMGMQMRGEEAKNSTLSFFPFPLFFPPQHTETSWVVVGGSRIRLFFFLSFFCAAVSLQVNPRLKTVQQLFIAGVFQSCLIAQKHGPPFRRCHNFSLKYVLKSLKQEIDQCEQTLTKYIY